MPKLTDHANALVDALEAQAMGDWEPETKAAFDAFAANLRGFLVGLAEAVSGEGK